MNEFQENVADTSERTVAERHIDAVRQQGGVFVEAVRRTRMPMLVTDATMPGNPIVFAKQSFVVLSGYSMDELLGQDPHFMNGEDTGPEAIRRYQTAIREARDATLEILQYRKDGTPFRAMLFASPVDDGQGTITNHFLSYLYITRRYDAEEGLRTLTTELEARVATRTGELEAASTRLSALVAEREMLLVEAKHRAKNSLAIAASLLAIQGRRQPDPAVRALFEEAQDRLNAMARVHDLLSKSERDQHVDVSMYVADLCGALRPITGDDDRVSLEADIAEGILVNADAAVPIGIVLTELITNAVKYALPAPRSGTILFRAHRSQSRWIERVVQDDGVGMLSLREGSLGYACSNLLNKHARWAENPQN
ncbi:histidine kinase dimerization/phosphoacceptor domain -containing protein [Microvirga terrestris]|uniref:Blue-light-activated histidine kinase n=1 Tax=Microvirga terrestris TaxID=2791024 RepID=A0ABS0HWZ9_9HYPH|nr:histidine kinase dimerization/phosphoacceptor domain -containing protein [Microvirga terrestris]MBF9198028.1 PAS domain-containing protein [Microvirga terrestris]